MTTDIGIMLVDNAYVYAYKHSQADKWRIPKRPSFDKQLLISVATGKQLVCTATTYNDLPDSVKKVVVGAKLAGPNSNTVPSVNLGGVRSLLSAPPTCLILVKLNESVPKQTLQLSVTSLLCEYIKVMDLSALGKPEEANIELWVKRTHDAE